MKHLFFTIIALLTLQSCKDIVAKNISGNTPVLILPQADDTVLINPVHFKWEAMEGATKYHLQIATPSFANITDYVLDSIVTGTDFYFAMDSMEYELKLTAINAGYSSLTLGPIKFWVGSAESSTETVPVPLLTPTNESYVNNLFDGNFTWGAISGGTNYQFRLVKGNTFVDGVEIHTTTPSNSFETTVPSTSLPLLPGKYFWGVKAYVGSVEHLYSINTFYVDTLKPNQPTLSLPSDATFVTVGSGSITFSWLFNATLETYSAPVTSTIQISTDINFTTIFQSNSAIEFSHDFTLPVGTYYWRVFNVDGAGNSSPTSVTRSITVVP